MVGVLIDPTEISGLAGDRAVTRLKFSKDLRENTLNTVRRFAPSRICIVCESFYPIVGGMERQAYVLATGLAKRGFQANVLTIRNPSSLPECEELDNFLIHRVAPGASRWSAMIPIYRMLVTIQKEYDLICVCGFRTLGIPAVLVGNRLKKKVVLRAENMGELSGKYFDGGLSRLKLKHSSYLIRPLNWVRQIILRQCDQFIAISSPIEREFRHKGVSSEKLSLIPNSVDLQCFRPAPISDIKLLRNQLALPQDSLIVCFTGRLVMSKGVLELLKAWKSMLSSQNTSSGIFSKPLLLVLVGEGGADTGNCELEAQEFCRLNQIDESVRFIGRVENVEDYLRASDIFALPTKEESFGLSILEAMACGLAVVTTSAGGLKDYVRHGENSLVIEPGNIDQIADALSQLICDPIMSRSLGARAQNMARSFSHERFVDRHVSLFSRLLSNPSPRRI